MINKKDIEIISNLRENSRQNLTSMARKTKVPVSTIFDRMKAHENGTKVINGYTCLVDFEQIGYGMRANVLIKVEKSQRNELGTYLEKHKSINSAYKINSEYDFLAECIFRNLKELDSFTEVLENLFRIIDVKVLYVVQEIKKEKFLCGNNCMEITADDDRKAYKTNLAQNPE